MQRAHRWNLGLALSSALLQGGYAHVIGLGMAWSSNSASHFPAPASTHWTKPGASYATGRSFLCAKLAR